MSSHYTCNNSLANVQTNVQIEPVCFSSRTSRDLGRAIERNEAHAALASRAMQNTAMVYAFGKVCSEFSPSSEGALSEIAKAYSDACIKRVREWK